jgi:hypothetical protein
LLAAYPHSKLSELASGEFSMATRRTPDSTSGTSKPVPAAPKPPTKAPVKAKAPKETAEPKPAAAPVTVPPVANEVSATARPAKPATKPTTTKAATATPARTQVSEDTRRGMIAEAAYLRAERRGFAPGGEHEDWMAAEREVDALLNANTGTGRQ